MNRRQCLLLVILISHGGLLAFSAAVHSPVVSEVKHLPAGLSHILLGRFDLFRVNPPLVRTVAALPVAMMLPATGWGSYDGSPLGRCDAAVARDFLQANGTRALEFFSVARWACIPFSIVGGYICFRWANELHGVAAGFMAMVLWCFCPYVLGHAALLTPDAHAAALGVAACYLLWRWLNRPTTDTAVAAGLALGLAELAKLTFLVFYPLWIVIWCVYKQPERGLRNARGWLREGSMLLGVLALGITVINLGYGFERSFQPLGEFRFRSELLNGKSHEPEGLRGNANRFAGTCWASLPVPLPANYLQGIDTERWDFECGLPTSYLHGQWALHGWWYYYLYALAIKLPLGTWCLILMAVPCSFSAHYRSAWRDELVLFLPIVAILTLVSSQTGFSIHSRYIIPILPFMYVWCSKVARSIEVRRRVVAAGATLALCWSVGSSLWYYPHSLSYFNELVGGPMGGHAHLLDSNIAWGQDLYFLKRWYDNHPEARPLHLAHCSTLFDPQLAGIEFMLPPLGPAKTGQRLSGTPLDRMGPLPGWYAVDVHHLHGARLAASDGHGGWQAMSRDGCDLTYFARFEPVATAGYSIYIYHITPGEANRVRRQLGLPQLNGRDATLQANSRT